MMNQYYNALELVKKLFDGIVDKGGDKYVNHLVRVSERVINEKSSMPSDKSQLYSKAAIVALLHDVVEDTRYTIDDLRRDGYDDDIILAVDAITRKKDEHCYLDYIVRLSSNEIAKVVKIHDLEDNMDITRLNELNAIDLKRLSKYWHCWRYLKGKISYGECYDKTCNNIKKQS